MNIDALCEMKPIELRMKKLWLDNPDRHLDMPCSKDSIEDILMLAFDQQRDFIRNDLDTEIPEHTFIPAHLDCSFVSHLRYTPVFWHKHEFFEMLCVLSGSCDNVFHNDEIHMEQGDICIHSPGTVHSVRAFTDDAVLLNIIIRQSTFDRSFFGLLEGEDILADFFHTAFRKAEEIPYLLFRKGEDDRIQSLILDALDAFSHDQKYQKPLLNAILSEIIVRIFQGYETTLMIPGAGNKTTSQKDWLEILRYTQENYRSITMQELARRFSYSERQLQRIFIQTTGSTFRDTVQKQKIRTAAEMLCTTDMSVSDIAYEVGFQAVNNFRKLFFKYYQLTPSEYRNRYRAK